MNLPRLLMTLTAALCFLAAADTAQAQSPYAFGQQGYFNPYLGNYFGASPYSLGRVPTPPYFALHPPVYYSGITPTTYGRTPFAQPAYSVFEMPREVITTPPAATPARSAHGPKVVLNPYLQDPAQPVSSPATRTVRIIENPYVRSSEAVAARP